MGIFNRIILAYLVLLIGLAVLSILALRRLDAMNEALDTLVMNTTRLTELHGKLADALFTEIRNERKFIIIRDRQLLKSFSDAGNIFAASLKESFSAADSENERKVLKKIEQLQTNYVHSFEKEAALIKKGLRHRTARQGRERRRMTDAMIEEINGLKSLNQANMVGKMSQLEESWLQTRKIASAVTPAAFLLGVIFAVLITRSITGPLLELKKKTGEIAKGECDSTLEISSPPEIAELASSFNLMCREVRNRSTEIQAAYGDLESFSFAVSHDLKSPIRRIEGFSEMLAADYGNRLDDKGRDILTKIAENTKKMIVLIDDLLAFSRVSKQEVNKAQIDMESAIKSICDEVRVEMGLDRKIFFEIKPAPAAYADLRMMKQVLLNLISNAVKFTRTRENAEIEIGGSSVNEENIYYVKDNGIGFDMEMRDKLFSLFQRLHPSRDYEGTGIGLVIVKRIIEKHGGRVWAEGTPDQGATFYFSLPLRSSRAE